jgi:hypothetical protein
MLLHDLPGRVGLGSLAVLLDIPQVVPSVIDERDHHFIDADVQLRPLWARSAQRERAPAPPAAVEGLLQADRQRTPKPSMPSLIIGIVIDSPYGCLGITRIANTDTSFETSSCQRAKRIHGGERWLFKKEHAFLTTRPPCPMAVAPQLVE